MAYLIQRATLTAIADQARRLTGVSALLSPAQIAAALSLVTSEGGESNCDSFRFYNFAGGGLDNIGNSGFDNNDNELTPLTALLFLDEYAIGPARSAYDSAILSRFNPVVSGHSGAANKNILAEIKMPGCASVDDEEFKDCDNIVSAYFPACMDVGEDAFSGCSLLESITLNSGCNIDYHAFEDTLVPNSKTFRLYLRGGSIGTCDQFAFGGILDYSSCGSMPTEIFYTTPVPGLEIYVPANLLSDFKTRWGGGNFADNIFALTD